MSALIEAAREIASLRAALKWYADGEHFTKSQPDAWDTVSGEPVNWWCDEAGTAMIEDGSLAGMVLAGKLSGEQLGALEDGEVAAAEAQPATSGWDGTEEWEALAWHLCAEENGEDACNELVWEGGPMPEPWGDRWLKYEGPAKEMIAKVRKFASAPAAPATAQPVGEPVAWGGLTEGERAQAVQSICEYGTGFVAPLFAVIEGVERTLERRNTAPPAQPAAQPLTDEQIAVLVLATVYDGDCSTPHRDAWAAEIGVPFARAIERAHGIGEGA